MRISEITELVEGTADAAFALDPQGAVMAWNKAAETIFGLSKNQAIGKHCREVVKGMDECGHACNENCTIRQRAQNRQLINNYDLQVQTKNKREWYNFSIMIVHESKSTQPYTIHIARPADLRKRFEILMRDFVVQQTSLSDVNVNEILSAKNTPTNNVDLSKREIEILKFLAKGVKTSEVADKLFISRTTVNNHIQNILKKLNAHSRLEAIRRAEQAGLI
ncbi:MAG TPA: LuxR C-terminal-related transcriptional regulator [Pyrinomonadaceae bacterium]|nr:LuxR C-terminal-related transcriptional regulator [Pyrinomonadaceae bacterium]